MKKFWFPSRISSDGKYKLAPSVHDRISAFLKSFKNRDAAHRLAVWLARMNAGPKRLLRSFPIDRRVLSLRPDLGLTEAQVRRAILTLEKIGFIEIVKPVDGVEYQMTKNGWRRLPIQFRFGFDFRKIFEFIARKAKSPIGRLESNNILKEESVVPALGYMNKRSSTLGFAVDQRRVEKPLTVSDLSKVTNDGLRDALQRLGSFVRGSKPVLGGSNA